MRILMIQPNYHSGGAEIAGNWPPSWVPYVGGALKQAGFTNVRFVDAMSKNIPDDVPSLYELPLFLLNGSFLFGDTDILIKILLS